MELMSALCLTAMVFMSLPLPFFASMAIAEFPAGRRAMTMWASAASLVFAAVAGWMIVRPDSASVALMVGAMSFVVCGLQMVQYLARAAAQAERNSVEQLAE